MKTRSYWVALFTSAALIVQAQAGGHHSAGGSFAAARSAPARGGAVSSFRSMPMRNFGGGRMIHSGPRSTSVEMRSPPSAAFRQHAINSNRGAFDGPRRFAPGNINRDNRFTQLSNGRDRFRRGGGAIENNGNGAGQVRSRNNLPTNWRSHVVAQHAANWHRDWDRSRDHGWHGHRCRFINGSWVVFDSGFYPGSYWYPEDYYASDYYADSYGYDDSGVYQGEEYTDSTVAVAQERLARQGYYRGEIDGIFGPETRRAIMRYQSDHGLRVTGRPDVETLRALESPRVGSN
jgi:hypothetical protein